MIIAMTWEELQHGLRARIKAKRGAQAEIAKRLDISRASVADYINGNRNIPVGHLDVILDILDIELDIRAKTQP